MKRKVAVFLLVLIMCQSLFGCENGSSDHTTESTDGSDASSHSETTNEIESIPTTEATVETTTATTAETAPPTVPEETISNEERGTPEQQIISTIYTKHERYEQFEITDLKITHNVDTVMHTDSVTASFGFVDRYGIYCYTESYTFQYDRTTDIWTELVDGYSYTTSPSKLRNTLLDQIWEGEKDVPFVGTLNYKIDIIELNEEEGWCHFSYTVYSYEDAEWYNGEAVLGLNDIDGNGKNDDDIVYIGGRYVIIKLSERLGLNVDTDIRASDYS